jgi:urease accessory protein
MPLAAAAHSGHAESFAAAFIHPLTGLDHLLAMSIVGVWAARRARQSTGAAALALPVCFVAAAAAGLVAARAGLALPLIEPALAASLIAFGLAVAAAAAVPLAAAAAVCAVFGFLHGVAHGAELAGAVWTAGAGLIAATAALHAAGFALIRAAGARLVAAARVFGAVVAMAGIALAARLAL